MNQTETFNQGFETPTPFVEELRRGVLSAQKAREEALSVLDNRTLLIALSDQIERGRRALDLKLTVAQRLNLPDFIRRPKTVDKASRILRDLSVAEGRITSVKDRVLKSVPTFNWEEKYPPEALVQGLLAYAVFKDFNNVTDSKAKSDLERAAQSVCLDSVFNDSEITFLMFSCPSLQADLLNGSEASYYVQKYAETNTVFTNRSTTKQFLETLVLLGLKPKLYVIFADTDEEDYIWPIIGRPTRIDPQAVLANRKSQKEDLQARLQRALPGTTQVLSWQSDMEKISTEQDREIATQVIEKILAYYTPDEFSQEVEFMKKSMTGWYQDALGTQTQEEIEAITKYKLATYARQGATLQRLFGSKLPILLQNETPPLMRTKMVNLLLTSPLPALYPFKY